jgi:hypothetical protein
MKQKKADDSSPKGKNEQGIAAPKFVRVLLGSISVDQKTASYLLQSRLRHLPQNCPTLTKEALDILVIAAPMILTKVKFVDTVKYELLAGTRTFQLMLEQLPRTTKCQAILVSAPSPALKNSFGAFDAVVSKLIQMGNELDLGVIAADLKQKGNFRKEVSRLMPLDTDQKLMASLGMTKSTFYRVIEEVKKNGSSGLSTPESTSKLDLGLTDLTADEGP